MATEMRYVVYCLAPKCDCNKETAMKRERDAYYMAGVHVKSMNHDTRIDHREVQVEPSVH